MPDDLKTLREATIAVGGLNTRLSLMTSVFAATVVAGGAAFWDLTGRIDTATAAVSDIKISSATQTEQLRAVNEKLAEIAVALSKTSSMKPIRDSYFADFSIDLSKKDFGLFESAVREVRPDQSLAFFVGSDNSAALDQIKTVLNAKPVSMKTLMLPSGAIYDINASILKVLNLSDFDKLEVSSDNPAVMKELIGKLDTLRKG